MHEWKKSINIQAPVDKVFDFTVNPDNTHLWIEGMVKEVASEYPPIIGTEYKNTANNKDWDFYQVASLIPNQEFTLVKKDNRYHVRYSYRALSDTATELEYHEWVTGGELENPFKEVFLEKLKNLLEA